MVTGLSDVFLLVSNLARSVQFYRQLLERVPVSEDARHARFELGPISLTVHEDLTPAELSAWKVDALPERRGWGVYLTFPTDELEQAHEQLVGIGAKILTRPRRIPWGTQGRSS
jgi:catechol 2,3-dioxygenase-like lactoylglutathione lyase family enzyme